MQSITELCQQALTTVLGQMEAAAHYPIYSGLPKFPTTWDVNAGFCEDFVVEVLRLAEQAGVEANMLWMDDMADELDDAPSHCVVVHNGRYYDAECLDGVSELSNIPVYQNQNKTRQQVLTDRGIC